MSRDGRRDPTLWICYHSRSVADPKRFDADAKLNWQFFTLFIYQTYCSLNILNKLCSYLDPESKKKCRILIRQNALDLPDPRNTYYISGIQKVPSGRALKSRDTALLNKNRKFCFDFLLKNVKNVFILYRYFIIFPRYGEKLKKAILTR